MASAAAVSTDIDRSPLPEHEVNDELGTIGTITSKEDAASAIAELDDNDEDVVSTSKRKSNGVLPNGANEEDDEGMAEVEAADKDLFGDTLEDKVANKSRQLDDEELDSGDDEERNDRALEDQEMVDAEEQQEELTFMDVELGRHPIPEPSDGELYLLKIPQFLAVDPNAFQPHTFQPPVTDHHSKAPPSATFSAYNAAMTTIRWRRSPANPSQLQSNARLLRWSDGSLSLQLASNPTTQYLVPGKPLAPPQDHPSKPTPTSYNDNKRNANRVNRTTAYNPDSDSFTYLAAPNERAQVLRFTNKITTSLVVQPSAAASDDALERLQMSLAAAVRGSNTSSAGPGIGTIKITEDPEMAKKKAELAEKEKLRVQKRREAQEMRDRERTGKVFSRRGPGTGLTVGGLEGDDEVGRGAGGGKTAGASGRKAKPKRQRRGEIYSDEEEEYGRRGRTKEDEYDEEDDFVAPSDEEEEVLDDDEDPDEGIEEERPVSGRKEKAKQRQETPKRSTPPDAEGEVDDGPVSNGLPSEGSPQARSKRRRVIEDEDE